MWSYHDDPLMEQQEILYHVIEDIGQAAIFEKTLAKDDTDTQDKVSQYFMLDRLCAPRKYWLWMFARTFDLWYNQYRDERDAWAERKTYAWFYDNLKKQTTQHDGKFKLDEATKSELLREAKQTVEDIFTGNQKQTTEKNTKTTDEQDSSRTGQSATSSQESGKDRSFAFAYPESNYSGGTIPYDLDNDPSVEFISTQGDTISKKNSASNTDTEDTDRTESSGTSTEAGNSTGTTNNQTDRTTNDNSTDTGNTDRDQTTETHWTEVTDRQGDNLNALYKDLANSIPETDFFRRFVRRLQPCFQMTYIPDEIMEDYNEF